MKLSVCTVNYYSVPQLRRFLQSFSDFRPHCLHEVIVVDNAQQKEEMKQLVTDFGSWVKVVSSSSNVGFGKAQNKAARTAKGEYLFFCNPDIEVEDESISRLIHYAEQHGNFGIMAPRLLDPDGSLQDSCRRFPTWFDLLVKRLGLTKRFQKRMDRYLMHDQDPEEVVDVDWVVGAAMLVKKESFLEWGGFDERFFLFFEDTDLCRRVHQKGERVVYVPQASFIHSETRLSSRGFWPFSKVFWIHLRSALQYFWKWKGVK